MNLGVTYMYFVNKHGESPNLKAYRCLALFALSHEGAAPNTLLNMKWVSALTLSMPLSTTSLQWWGWVQNSPNLLKAKQTGEPKIC